MTCYACNFLMLSLLKNHLEAQAINNADEAETDGNCEETDGSAEPE